MCTQLCGCQKTTSRVWSSLPPCLKQGLLLLCARLACLPGIFLSPLPILTLGTTGVRETHTKAPAVLQGLGIWSHDLTVVWQVLYLLHHLTSSMYKHFKTSKFAKIILLNPHCIQSARCLCFQWMRMCLRCACIYFDNENFKMKPTQPCKMWIGKQCIGFCEKDMRLKIQWLVIQ